MFPIGDWIFETGFDGLIPNADCYMEAGTGAHGTRNFG